jgi:hypothetical protein
MAGESSFILWVFGEEGEDKLAKNPKRLTKCLKPTKKQDFQDS